MTEDSAQDGPRCPKCPGTMAKQESGWTCSACGYAPFSGEDSSKVPAPTPLQPRDVLPAPVESEPPAASVAPESSDKVLFTPEERPPLGMRLTWGDAGGGLLFSYRTPLATLPPGEAVPVEVVAYNRGPNPVAVEYDVRVASKSGDVVTYHSETGDLPPQGIFDTTYQVRGPSDPEGCVVSVRCQTLEARGARQDPGVAPELKERPGPLARVMPAPPSPVRFRTSVSCPRCDSRMAWTPGGPNRKRAWACDECGHRVETGILG